MGQHMGFMQGCGMQHYVYALHALAHKIAVNN